MANGLNPDAVREVAEYLSGEMTEKQRTDFVALGVIASALIDVNRELQINIDDDESVAASASIMVVLGTELALVLRECLSNIQAVEDSGYVIPDMGAGDE